MRARLAVGRAEMYEIGGKVSGASEGPDAAIVATLALDTVWICFLVRE